nr:MAG TPA: hypothetical protein [Caudoviricetes sp.]
MFTFFRVGSTGAFINIIKCRKKLYFIDYKVVKKLLKK